MPKTGFSIRYSSWWSDLPDSIGGTARPATFIAILIEPKVNGLRALLSWYQKECGFVIFRGLANVSAGFLWNPRSGDCPPNMKGGERRGLFGASFFLRREATEATLPLADGLGSNMYQTAP